MRPSYLILLLVMNFFWAGVYSAYKVIAAPTGLSAGNIVTLRFGLAGLCLFVFWPFYKGPGPKGKDLLKTGLMGVVVYVLGQRLQVYGNQLGTAGNSSVLMAVEPLIASVAAAVFLREKLGPRRVLGFALGLLGVGLLNRFWSPDFH